MSQAKTPLGPSVVAVYPDHEAAERAVRRLNQGGFSLQDLSIVGRDCQVTEEPVGYVTPGEYARAGAETGAAFGGLLGLLAGAAFLVLPGVGPVVIAGPLAAALLGGVEGALAGAALGSLGGALVGWGVPKEHAVKYETEVKAGKFLVIVLGKPDIVAHARRLLAADAPEQIDVYETPPS